MSLLSKSGELSVRGSMAALFMRAYRLFPSCRHIILTTRPSGRRMAGGMPATGAFPIIVSVKNKTKEPEPTAFLEV